MTGPSLLDLDTHVLVEPVNNPGGDDAIDDGAGKQVRRGGPRQSYLLIAALVDTFTGGCEKRNGIKKCRF